MTPHDKAPAAPVPWVSALVLNRDYFQGCCLYPAVATMWFYDAFIFSKQCLHICGVLGSVWERHDANPGPCNVNVNVVHGQKPSCLVAWEVVHEQP